MKDLKIESVKYVSVSTLFPQSWEHWIYTALSENAPFSWGDNNHSLVDSPSFMNHLQDIFDYHDEKWVEIKEYKDSIFDTLNYLSANQILIDMES